jgi:hypothetical protein
MAQDLGLMTFYGFWALLLLLFITMGLEKHFIIQNLAFFINHHTYLLKEVI